MSTYENEAEIRRIVEGFESCATGKGDFKHVDHLAVAVCYLQNATIAEATKRLRDSLLRFVDHHGVDRQKYNETITVFWLELTALQLERMGGKSLVDQCNSVTDTLGDGSLIFQYYSSDLLCSPLARERFVEPDLKSWK
jgi:hypothetical protein